jgi:N-acetylmuramoyl-L-alanine amidase
VKSFSLLAVLGCTLAAPALAQEPPRLRFEDQPAIAGRLVASAPCYSVSAAEAAGGRAIITGTGARLILFGDTIELEATSPFVRVRGEATQLAHPVSLADGEPCIPEQFFLQWLPTRYPSRISYREGVLRLAAAPPGEAAPGGSRPGAAGSAARPPEKRVVVIDPGHGGPDNGRIGPNGLPEKDVVLTISNRLAAVLRARGYEVHLTRTRDTLVALADRPRLANRWKGDRPVALFVSIHANAAPGRQQAQGFETFFLSDARTEDERRVAEMENASVAFEEQTSANHGSDFEQLLNTLRNDFYVRASNDLAAVIQDHMAVFHPGPNRGVKRAGFRVLVGAIMPAVLVEVAFISDREEARALARTDFQQQLANGIAGAVDTFFAQNEHLWVEPGR